MPRDGFGRRIDYLRISLIDECNLRCVYCMDPDDRGLVPSEALLSAEEIGTVAAAAASIGFRKIRLTGGEPTLRPDLVEVVRAIARESAIADLSLTTNAIRLPALAAPLAAAGLDRVNVHLDTIDAERLPTVMRGARLASIWAGIEAAEAAGLGPIKLNVVVVRGYNDDVVAELAALAVDRAWHVRFIETMPLGCGAPARLAREHFVPTTATRKRIEAVLGPLEPLEALDPSDEAVNFRVRHGAGVVGFISPVSAPYCDTCNRMRLTADGKFHLCLLNDDELDVRGALRAGGGVTAVATILERAVAAKPVGHRLQLGAETTHRQMHQLGG